MLGFKQYLEEKHNVTIDIKADSGWLKRIPEINADLAKVTAKPFLNSPLFVNACRGTLERYGILLPAFQAVQQVTMELDVVYALGESGYYIHMVHNMDCNGNVDGHCKILTQAELDSLAGQELIPDEEEGCCDDPAGDAIQRMRRQVRRTNDDSGNDDEY
jgi:hypothetical protein